jgi:CRISPR system Cascade subunit CasE
MAFPYPDTKARDPAFLKPYRPCGFRDPRPAYCAGTVVQHRPCATVEPPPVHVPRDTEHNFLFRIDPQPGGRVVILVQSAIQPDWDYAFHNAGHLLAAPPETKPVERQFELGQHLRFRLLANPTKKIETLSKEERLAKVPKRHGKRVPVDTADLATWISRRGDRSGFCIEDVPTIQVGYVYVNSGREAASGQRLRSVLYEGLLQVTELEEFRAALVSGIGPAKAFGFGLLSAAPVR